MAVITIFSGAFCRGDQVAEFLSQANGLELVLDEAVTREASKRFQISQEKFHCALSGETSVFNRFTHEKERCLAHVKGVLSGMLDSEDLLFSGFAGHLIPKEITHVLRVGLVAENTFRVQRAMEEKGLKEHEAVRALQAEDKKAGEWIEYLFQTDPWNPELYDILLPMDNKTVEEAARFIWDNAQRDILKPTPESKRAVKDFELAVKVETALGREGHDVGVSAREGQVTLTINKHVLLLSRLEEELVKIAMDVPAVKKVTPQVGPGYYKSNIYRKMDFNQPSKVVLVDDEKEFAETLSERLLMRDMGAAVVYNGEQALSLMEKEEPEVMVLDLKMPGINGMALLHRVKEEHPNVEVIVLTGEGSVEDETACMDMGAFAYLEKPVDVDVLAETMREAYRKVRERGSNVSNR